MKHFFRPDWRPPGGTGPTAAGVQLARQLLRPHRPRGDAGRVPVTASQGKTRLRKGKHLLKKSPGFL